MSDKQQSSVQYLEEQLKKVLIDNQIQQTEYLFDQAKELFKQQIIYAYANGYIDGVARNKVPAEQYFNETFKTESNGTT